MTAARSLILGLDASARRIGWALVDYETAEIVSLGCIATPAGDDLRNRRNAVCVIAAAARRLGDVCAVFVEDAYAGPSIKGTIQHASAVGSVEAFALERWPPILVERIYPSTWRRLLGLPGRGKEPVFAWAQARNPERGFWTQDEVDAVAIATAGHALVWEMAEPDTSEPERVATNDVGLRRTARKTTDLTNGKEANGE